jgi:cholesterol oxidase
MPSSLTALGTAETTLAASEFDFDQVIIGSGFGGSVSALRLSEKGHRVLVRKRQTARRHGLP